MLCAGVHAQQEDSATALGHWTSAAAADFNDTRLISDVTKTLTRALQLLLEPADELCINSDLVLWLQHLEHIGQRQQQQLPERFRAL
jgi:hypothetical protein